MKLSDIKLKENNGSKYGSAIIILVVTLIYTPILLIEISLLECIETSFCVLVCRLHPYIYMGQEA
jgi:hypothetical protein